MVSHENSTSTTPSDTGAVSSGSSKAMGSTSAGAAGSSGASQESKAYEISKNIVENGPDSIIKFIALAIICEILLVVGFKRRETEEN